MTYNSEHFCVPFYILQAAKFYMFSRIELLSAQEFG